MVLAAVLGLLSLIRENPRLILKTRNARYNAIIVLTLLAATCTALCLIEPSEFRRIKSWSQAISHWSALTAMALGFLSVSLVPKPDRRNDKLSSLDATGWIVFVGTLLVVFGLSFVQ
jgi:ABC-type Na+ efflux pump permease subunit